MSETSFRERYSRAISLQGSARYQALYDLGSDVQSALWKVREVLEKGAAGNLIHNFNGAMSSCKHFAGKVERGEPVYGYKTGKLHTPEELAPVIAGWDKTIVQNLDSMIALIEEAKP